MLIFISNFRLLEFVIFLFIIVFRIFSQKSVMVEFKQDMPPEGGYAPITYKRVPLKPRWNPFVKIAAVVLYTIGGTLWWHKSKNVLVNQQIEMKCANVALMPMLQAEVDRMLLKQLKKNRDVEEEIMKDVKGWEVGKWQGMPVYLSLKPDEFFKPFGEEYFVHARREDVEHSFFVFRDS